MAYSSWGSFLAELGAMQRQQKITLREMRESGPTRLIVYCGDYKCRALSSLTPTLA
jgi:hypothetical protein